MADVIEHYERLLSGVYSWMAGGFDNAIRKHTEFFRRRDIVPGGAGVAIDLGAGCGFQSIPLAQAGFSVTAIDTDGNLLAELRAHAGELPVRAIQGDLSEFDAYVDDKAELIVCMTDTILHLADRQSVIALFNKVSRALEDGGLFILTFSDMSSELRALERFIPVRSSDDRIFTCFLEYEPDTVKVHDLLYTNEGGEWRFATGYYGKLRLSREWVGAALMDAGFVIRESSEEGGFVTMVATK